MDSGIAIGEILHGTYRILREIAQGGMGVVYEAEHLRLTGKRVAVKVLRASVAEDRVNYLRFRREAEIVSALGHANIVSILDFNELPGGRPYMVMEYLEGEDLGAALNRRGALPPDEVARIIMQTGLALQVAHEEGVVHRDLKPGNIFLAHVRGGPPTVKLLDFGISKVLHADGLLTQDCHFVGTPYFMSPEQAQGDRNDVDHTTDIFALGAIAYVALSGKFPFDAPTLPGVFYQVVHEQPRPIHALVSGLSDEVQQVLDRAMAKAKQDRYQRAADFAAHLRAALLGPSPILAPFAHPSMLPEVEDDDLGTMVEENTQVTAADLRPEEPTPEHGSPGVIEASDRDGEPLDPLVPYPDLSLPDPGPIRAAPGPRQGQHAAAAVEEPRARSVERPEERGQRPPRSTRGAEAFPEVRTEIWHGPARGPWNMAPVSTRTGPHRPTTDAGTEWPLECPSSPDPEPAPSRDGRPTGTYRATPTTLSSSSAEAPTEHIQVHNRRTRLRAVLGGLGVGLLLAGLLAILWPTDRGMRLPSASDPALSEAESEAEQHAARPPGPTSAPLPPAVPPAADKERVQILLDLTPPETRVLLDGHPTSDNPLQLAADGKEHRLRLEADGHQAQEVMVRGSPRQSPLVIALVPVASPPDPPEPPSRPSERTPAQPGSEKKSSRSGEKPRPRASAPRTAQDPSPANQGDNAQPNPPEEDPKRDSPSPSPAPPTAASASGPAPESAPPANPKVKLFTTPESTPTDPEQP